MSRILRIQLNQEFFQRPPEQIKYKTQIGVCVQETLKSRGFTRAENGEKWDIFWAQKEMINNVYQNHRVTNQQKINHFRSYYELCRKDNLNRNLKRHKKNLQKEGYSAQAAEFNFFPLTYHLPIQYNVFCQQFKKSSSEKQNVWIMKPVSKSQGKGIFLFNKISTISQWGQNMEAEAYVVQRYISNPLLIGGKKFDLRLYVLAKSYKPLKAYIYREGFARFTTQRYDGNDLQNSQVHLTNVAIQKHSSDYNKDNGGKWQLKTLKTYMLSRYNVEQVNKCFVDIQKLIFKTLKGVTKIMTLQKNCFQLYGFDILIDDIFKPWLIQVNGSPSMRANTPQDRLMKCGIIDDVLTIVDLQKILNGDQTRIGGFDLICNNDVEINPNARMSMLGCINNRQKSYFNLARQINKKGKSFTRTEVIESPKKFSIRKSRITSLPKKQNPQKIEMIKNQQVRQKLSTNDLTSSKNIQTTPRQVRQVRSFSKVIVQRFKS